MTSPATSIRHLVQQYGSWAWVLAVAVFSFQMLLISLPYTLGNYESEFMVSKQDILHKKLWRWSLYAHILTSLPVLLSGIVQFVPSVLKNRPLLHRNLGAIYITLILLVAAPSGLVLGWYANGGPPAQASFVLLSVLWWLFTLQAWRMAILGRWTAHRAWMYRSYALTFSAITLRLIALLLPRFVHIPGVEMYILMAWASWLPNLLLAELLQRWLARGGLSVSTP